MQVASELEQRVGDEDDYDSGRVTLPAVSEQSEFGDLLPANAPYFAAGFLIVTRVNGQLAYLVGQEKGSEHINMCTTFSGIRQGRSENIWRTAVREMREESIGAIHLSSLRTVAVTFRTTSPKPYVLYIATIASRLLPLILEEFAQHQAHIEEGDLESVPYFVTRRILRSSHSMESALFPFLEMRGLAVVRARDFRVLMQSAGAPRFESARFHAELQSYLTLHRSEVESYASPRSRV